MVFVVAVKLQAKTAEILHNLIEDNAEFCCILVAQGGTIYLHNMLAAA